ncbi:MAG: hypothetical protein ACE5G2_07460 [Candidatus Krumholzibacteriia bacterium]
MSNTHRTVVLAGLLLGLVCAGCHQTSRPYEPAGLQERLRAAPEVRELLRIRNEMTSRAIDRNVRPAELQEAYARGDEHRVAELLGYTAEDLVRLGSRLHAASESLFAAYPDLPSFATPNPAGCTRCNAQRLASYLDAHRSGTASKSEVVHCEYVPYVAALATCTAAGPILYWPCAIVATCVYCGGGWVDALCG